MRTILVGGGKGGVGKSSISAGLARSLSAAGQRVGLLDADLSGPSQALLFECSGLEVRDGAITPARSSDGVQVISSSLVARSTNALVWSDATAVSAINLLTDSKVWRDVDTLVVDLPPGHGEIPTRVAKNLPDSHAVLVTTGSPLALEECSRAMAFFGRLEIPVLGVVHNMSHYKCPHCMHDSPVFAASVRERFSLSSEVFLEVAFGEDPSPGRGLEPLVDAVLRRD